MSCWVVASLAADYLRMSVDAVLEKVRSGLLPAKTELGFLLVDVDPYGPRVEGGVMQPASKPPTYKSVDFPPLSAPALIADDLPDDTMLDHTEDGPLDWRATRLAMGRKRRAPRQLAMAA